MTSSEIKQGLTTKFVGQNIQIYQKLDSTNDEAIRQALNDAVEGTLILTETQTAGRGKHGKKWMAPAHSSILGSIILYPKINSRRQGIVTLLTAVAVAKAIHESAGLTAMIKWPNDVMIGDKKVSGILIETGPMNSMIVGFGVNVNISQENMPHSIATTASSVQIALGSKFSRAKLLRNLLANFEKLYLWLNAGKQDKILNEIRALSCTIGKDVKIRQYDLIIAGNVWTIDDDGGLLIRTEYGTWEKVYTGQVT